MSRVPCRVVSVTCAVCCLRAARPCVRSAAARAAGCARAFFNIKEYGDSMILAVCIFSQSATGEVSCAYFRRYLGVGSANFRKRAPNGDEGEEEGDEHEEEGEEEARRNPNLIAAATKFPM